MSQALSLEVGLDLKWKRWKMEKEEVDKMGQWHLWRIGDLNLCKTEKATIGNRVRLPIEAEEWN